MLCPVGGASSLLSSWVRRWSSGELLSQCSSGIGLDEDVGNERPDRNEARVEKPPTGDAWVRMKCESAGDRDRQEIADVECNEGHRPEVPDAQPGKSGTS